MRSVTFPGGVHPPYRKAASIAEPLRTAAVPEEVVIPLSQHIGAPCEAVVAKGDKVEEGQVLGRSDSFISALVHSPVTGEVKKIEKRHHPSLGPVRAVVIKTDEDFEPAEYKPDVPESLEPQAIINRVKEAGVVGMGGAAFPTHVKLSVPEGKDIDTLIINGAECEPYLTCDHILMTHMTEQIMEGIKLLEEVLAPETIYIAVEDNKKAACFAFEKLLKKEKGPFPKKVHIVPLRTKYPQGGEKQLIKAIIGAEVPPGGLPMDIGCLVQNVGTVHAVYEAVYRRKPLIERIVTVAGDCLEAPCNCLVRVGTTVEELLKNNVFELRAEPERIIFGGPMMGFSQPHADVPILKSTSGILLLSERDETKGEEVECVKCAKCVDVCPVNLLPTKIMNNVRAQKWDLVEGYNISDCMECGSCGYSCPSRIPLVHYIKEGKFMLSRRERRT